MTKKAIPRIECIRQVDFFRIGIASGKWYTSCRQRMYTHVYMNSVRKGGCVLIGWNREKYSSDMKERESVLSGVLRLQSPVFSCLILSHKIILPPCHVKFMSSYILLCGSKAIAIILSNELIPMEKLFKHAKKISQSLFKPDTFPVFSLPINKQSEK